MGTPDFNQNRPGKRFHLIMIKPTHYDDDGYPIQWLRSFIPSNTLACLNGIALDSLSRGVLGPDADVRIEEVPGEFLACGIGLPIAPVAGDMNGLRIGTPELVRWGVNERDVPQIAALIARALRSTEPEALAAEVASLRSTFDKLHFICS